MVPVGIAVWCRPVPPAGGGRRQEKGRQRNNTVEFELVLAAACTVPVVQTMLVSYVHTTQSGPSHLLLCECQQRSVRGGHNEALHIADACGGRASAVTSTTAMLHVGATTSSVITPLTCSITKLQATQSTLVRGACLHGRWQMLVGSGSPAVRPTPPPVTLVKMGPLHSSPACV